MQESFFVKDTHHEPDPFAMFRKWFDLAQNTSGIQDATAFSLATCRGGRPSVRIILLKSIEKDGFTFFTNENSHKGQDLLANPHAEMCFYWAPLGKQIRIYGNVAILDGKESDKYFASRALESRFGACVSRQSSELSSYDILQKEYIEYTKTHAEPKRPPYWHGFKVIPKEFEFWLEGWYRLHLRHKYKANGQSWQHGFLYP